MVQHISQVLNRVLAPYFMYDTTTKEWQQHESYSRRNSLSYSTFVVVRTTLKTGHQSLLQARVVHALSPASPWWRTTSVGVGTASVGPPVHVATSAILGRKITRV